MEACADVQTPCSSGLTPIMSAAEGGYAPLVRLLHQHGADLRMQSVEGRTVLHLATANSHLEVRGK